LSPKKFVTVVCFLLSVISRRACLLAVNKKGIANGRCETYLWMIKLRSKLGDFTGCGAGAHDYACC
jgi:hypothetical protein